jgi:hypothetical protein
MDKCAVGRKRKKNGFTQISNSMLEDNQLSWRAKGLLAYMLSRPDNWKINKADLLKRGTEGRDAMQGALKELKDLGYLHIYSKTSGNGQIAEWVWEYDDVPFEPTVLKNHITEKQQQKAEIMPFPRNVEKPSSGKTVVRFSSTYNNTDLNNTDLNNTESKEIKKNEPKKDSAEFENEFEQLWKLYPKKEGKKDAKAKYLKLRKANKISYETVENGLYKYLEHLSATNEDYKFIPKGSSWFNQERWQDEYTNSNYKQKPKNPLQAFKMASFEEEQNEYPRSRKAVNDYSDHLQEPLQGF